MQVDKLEDYVDAIELHLLNEWHLHNARARRAERERRQQPALRQLLTEAQCWALAAVLMALSGVVWG